MELYKFQVIVILMLTLIFLLIAISLKKLTQMKYIDGVVLSIGFALILAFCLVSSYLVFEKGEINEVRGTYHLVSFDENSSLNASVHSSDAFICFVTEDNVFRTKNLNGCRVGYSDTPKVELVKLQYGLIWAEGYRVYLKGE